MVEELRQGVTDLVEPGPIQITQDDPLFGFLLRGFNQSHLFVEISPGLAVEDQSIDPSPKLRVHVVREIVLPPKIKRKIGVEMRKHDARQPFDARSLERKRNLFRANLFGAGATDMAMRVDPCLNAILL